MSAAVQRRFCSSPRWFHVSMWNQCPIPLISPLYTVLPPSAPLRPQCGSLSSTLCRTQGSFSIYHVQYFGLRQEHSVILSQMHRLDCLRKAKTAAVLDIIHSEVQPWGVGRPASWQRWCRVDPVITMTE